MENYSYQSYPDSGDSSPRSREIEAENAVSWDETPPLAPIRVKLMCSYGGRIQPRSHDNQLSYFGGETKILAVDRSIRFPSIIAKLSSLCGAASPDEICCKYQLPGEDLDSLISVTNDEDLDHMMIEYDRLHRSSAKPTARLRLFLFPTNTLPRPAASAVSGQAEQKNDRQWFVEGLNSIPVQLVPALEHNPLQPPPPPPPQTLFPDFLSGIVPPPAPVNVKDPVPESVVGDPLPSPLDVPTVRSDLGKEEWQQIAGETVISPSTEVQNQFQEIQRLQIVENQHQQQVSMQRNSSEESLTKGYHGDYYAPRVQDMAPAATTQIPAPYWPDQRSMAAGRYTSMAGGEHPVYLIPTSHGVYSTTPGTGYYTAAPPAAMAMYPVAPPPPHSVFPEGSTAVRGPPGIDSAATTAAAAYAAAQMAYDSTGRAAVFYSGAVPTYQTITSVAHNPEPKMAKPSQVS
ncbi:hypothetical protein AXF42_Ash001319 [Apostasia shenzhenica]|uniref:PB1 domain-containing protein n=1 Tax=Apostasia shenzhenica TaxID=1088818 RepID=A0A2I0AUP6_9ASPA|nr:hypothetical protein AXF42_Ash001319 [Apostasia shenzhenica]